MTNLPLNWPFTSTMENIEQHHSTDTSAVNDIAIHEPSESSQPENVLPEPLSQTDGTEYENVITVSSQAG